MSREINNDCIGCEVCMCCGRDYDYEVAYCDECNELIDSIHELHIHKGMDLCETCYAKATISNETVVECLEELLNEMEEDDHEDFKWSLLVAIDKFK